MTIISRVSKWFLTDDNDKRKVSVITALLSATIVCAVLASLIMKLRHIAPFGESSFASADANYQYLDFFAYLRDCLLGKNSLKYTLSSGLGGSTIGLFAYYLASPFNLLVVFFSKSELNNFFSLLVVLKLALAGCTMSVFLNKRFQYKLKPYWVVLFSISYALMQYNLAQNSNIMWLDGVYMLPIVLLGTYYAAKRGRTTLLSISVALAIIFNWYAAGIDCLYSIVWFIMELLLDVRNGNNYSKRDIVRRCLRYAWGMTLGVLMSACLFLPTILSLRQGRGSSFDWDSLKSDFSGNIIRSAQLYTVGGKSDKSGASFYCGCLALIGAVGYFASQNVSRRDKRVAGVMLLFSILIFYWQPLEITYSLFKDASSYWFRYAYVTSFLMIFLAASYFRQWEKEQNVTLLLKISCGFGLLLLVLQLFGGSAELKLVYYTVGFLVIEALLLVCARRRYDGLLRPGACMAILALVVLAELFENGKVLAGDYSIYNVADYRKYVSAQQKQIDAIKKRDHVAYRISQATTRNEEYSNNKSANLNESLAFGYDGIASYTSTSQSSSLDFLSDLGYRKEGNRATVVDASILPVDSLLGVKYVLSDTKISGYEKLDGMPVAADGKNVYRNSYALPMAFTANTSDLSKQVAKSAATDNPFEYTNVLYSKLLGHEVKVFEPAKYRAKAKADGSYEYRLYEVHKGWPVYGNIIFAGEPDVLIDVNGAYTQGYATWFAPSVFHIPVDGSAAKLKLTSANPIEPQEAQFYAANLDEMRKVTSVVSKRPAKFSDQGGGRLSIDAKGNRVNDSLILSVPYDSGWSATDNGKPVRIEMFAGSLMKVPLKRGRNHLEFTYHTPGLLIGAVVSVIGVVLLIVGNVFERKR